MRLYSGKVPTIATEVVRALLASNDIEAEKPKEVEADITSVLNQYLADEREVNERAKDILERTGKPQSDFQRVRQLAAQEKGIQVGDEALDYLLDQVVEMLMHSQNVDEVYVADVDLRRRMAPAFKKHMAVDDGLDGDVRAQLKHLREGTSQWDVEYARVLEGIKRAGKKDRAAITDAITNLRDFDGVLGKWSFDQNGDTSLKVMAVEEIKDGKFTPVKIVGM